MKPKPSVGLFEFKQLRNKTQRMIAKAKKEYVRNIVFYLLLMKTKAVLRNFGEKRKTLVLVQNLKGHVLILD